MEGNQVHHKLLQLIMFLNKWLKFYKHVTVIIFLWPILNELQVH
jgi:hypothetical protein